MKVVIIGGVASGMGVATKLKRLDNSIEVIVFERGNYVSFANCGLPYFIGGKIDKAEKLILQTPEFFKKRFDIDVHLNTQVLSIDTSKKTVKVQGVVNGDVSYDKLVIATGGSPIMPQIEGINNENIFSLWTIPDAIKIDNFIKNNNPKTAVVIGGGFIGIEMAEALRERNLDVTVIEKASHIIPPIDFEYAQMVSSVLKNNGVKVLTDKEVVSFGSNSVNLKDGTSVQSDLTILSIGVKSNSELATSCSLKLGKNGGIETDEYLQTSNKDIYACGDVVESFHIASKQKMKIPLAGIARKQARVVAKNIVSDIANDGMKTKYPGTSSASVIKVFDHTLATVGLSSENLERFGVANCKTISVSDTNHPTYYPGSVNLTMSLTYDKNTRLIFGATAFGKKDVEKRIDTVSVAMWGNMKIDDLQHVDFCYAPPYNSPTDHVNHLSTVAENDCYTPIMNFNEFVKIYNPQTDILLDVRTKDEVKNDGCVAGSLNIPVDEIDSSIDIIPKGKRIFIHCKSGKRSYLAQTKLLKHFKDVTNISGGFTMIRLSKHFEEFKL